MKKVLIVAIGCSLNPWKKMFSTSLQTWDSVEVDGVETVFYFGLPYMDNTEKAVYFPVPESYNTMGEKMLCAFEWALKNREFDCIARVNSSCYVDKKELIKQIQEMPDKTLFSCIEVEGSPKWAWGGGQYIISRDVLEKIVENRSKFNHKVMEDQGLSYLINDLNIPYTKGKACSINKREGGWTTIAYGSESFEFTDFNECKNSGQYFYRVKQDHDRNEDEYVMNQLYDVLK